MPVGDGDKEAEAPVAKPKRVRTGCLTCRERHLKCDEGLPNCNNCKKSNRECKRGLRLNFIDTWVDRPPHIVTLWGTPGWKVEFQDESREIAGEYRGGAERYKPIAVNVPMPVDPTLVYDFHDPTRRASLLPNFGSISDHNLMATHGMAPTTYHDRGVTQHSTENMTNLNETDYRRDSMAHVLHAPNSGSTNGSHYGPRVATDVTRNESVTNWTNGHSEMSVTGDEEKEYLDSQEETLFMQVFVEEVGSWMDSMDSMKHFSRLLPFHSLSEPMLSNAFLACGARHLTLVNPAYPEEKALHYYDTATRHLLKNLQDPNRDTVICATTAVILNVYEIMSERALQRMNHIAGARALIKECGWSARSHGIGAACFWLNVGLEVLSCLHFNWQVAWDPDEWGIDMDLTRESQNCREEIWTHRMLYLIAKVCNFRATAPRHQDLDPREQQTRTQQRYEQWCQLKGLIDAWNEGIPRTMHPMAYVHAYHTSSKSCFPEVWMVKRTTIVARLFYHTALLLMAQVHPYYSSDMAEMADTQRRHSQMICGIVAHVKDRGVASVALRSLAHAAEVLTDRREQEEVLAIFDKINRETGWRIGFVYKELKERWGWHEQPSLHEQAQTHTAAKQQLEAANQRKLAQLELMSQTSSPQHVRAQSVTSQPRNPQQSVNGHQQITPPSRPPAGIPNPLYAKADFNLPQHPYQNFYVAPNQHHQQQLNNFSLGVAYGNGHDHHHGIAAVGE